jgi:archaellum component FlaG (FlaF/FlaG flagellin family)
MKLFITLLENVNKSRTSAGNHSLTVLVDGYNTLDNTVISTSQARGYFVHVGR